VLQQLAADVSSLARWPRRRTRRLFSPIELRLHLNRRESAMLLRSLLVSVMLLAACSAMAQDSATTPLATESQGGIIVADLEEQLFAGLKLRRDEEKAFVAAVINLVETKRLPVSLVKSVFHWARRKNSKTPFPYFERAMRLTAERIGVEIVVPTS
jgi:hypothetical protein